MDEMNILWVKFRKEAFLPIRYMIRYRPTPGTDDSEILAGDSGRRITDPN